LSFQDQALEAFDAFLDVMKEGVPLACVMRFPVTRAGADKSGTDDYDAIPSPSPDRLDLITGGFLEEYQFSMSARRDDFATLPIAGDLFKMNGRVSRILFVENSELSPVVVFHCGTPDK
jgi:hypothetical protein